MESNEQSASLADDGEFNGDFPRDAMTTNGMSFFRDALPVMSLARDVLLDIVRSRSIVKRLRIWSAACSSGQEVFSLAMSFAERFPELSPWRVELLVSDVSTQMVARCRSVADSRHGISRGLSQERIERHALRRAGTRAA